MPPDIGQVKPTVLGAEPLNTTPPEAVPVKATAPVDDPLSVSPPDAGPISPNAPADPPAAQYPWTAVLVGDRPVWFGTALPTSPDWVAPFLWFNTTTETLSAVLADASTGYSDTYSDIYA